MSVPGSQGPCSQMDVAVGSVPGGEDPLEEEMATHS